MANQITDDLLNEANSAKEPPTVRVNFGQIAVDMWRCVLQKGQGKVQYDPGQHSADQRRLAIDMTLTPLASSRFHDPIARNLIAESKEWTQIVRPSLEGLHTDIRGVNGKFVQVEMVETGRTWKDKNGEDKKGTNFKFVKIFANEQECEAAAAAFFNRSAESNEQSAPTATPSNGHANGAAAIPDPGRAMAAKFLGGLWKASNGDVDEFLRKIQSNSLTAKHFTLESPEVIAVVSGSAA